jgi:hypothetical protein
MASTFSIQINQADMAEVRRMLAGMDSIAAKVFSRGVNKTLSGVKTDASAEIRKELNAKKSGVDKGITLLQATVTKLSASVVVTGQAIPLIDFIGTSQTKTGVSVLVKKTGTRKIIPRTFVATLKSGHKGVFWREWHDKTASPAGKKRNIPFAKLPKKYRLPMSERYGPGAPDIMSNTPVMTAVLKKADDRLHKNILHELEFELSQMK